MAFFKTERITDKDWLRTVATELPCVITHSERGIQSHHLMRDEMQRIIRGTGKRAQDNFVIPLRHDIHQLLHFDGNEPRFLMEHGIYRPVELALTLFANKHDMVFCRRLVLSWGVPYTEAAFCKALPEPVRS